MTGIGAFILLSSLFGSTEAAAGEVLFEELVTVTEDGFAVGWDTADSTPSVLYYGESADDLQPYEEPGAPTSNHHLVIITGLASDTEYYYSTGPASAQLDASKEFSPGYVRTLAPPPGNYLFSFATVNDTHVGEDVAGLITIGDISLTPGFTWPDPDNPYWRFTNEQAVRQINAQDVDFVVHKGDVTSTAEESQYEDAKAIFGQLDAEIHYARGNHDRPHGDHDYFKEVLGIEETYYYFDNGPVRIVVMDTEDAGSGVPSSGQIPWLKQVMAQGGGIVVADGFASTVGVLKTEPDELDALVTLGVKEGYLQMGA